MKFAPTILAFSILLLNGFSIGCNSSENTNANANSQAQNTNSNTNKETKLAKDDIEELETTIKLPFHPEEALWRDEPLGNKNGDNRVPSQNERKLTIVLKFTTEEANKIVEQAEKVKPAQPAEMETEVWFPPELIAKSQQSGNESIKGQTYAADEFYQSPYLNGKITRIDGTDFFVLELFSM